MEPIQILSLGAGVQSSTLALMAAKGEITPMPNCAIFADTQDEAPDVYEWLDKLEKELPFPVHRVSRGRLSDDFIAALNGTKSRCGQPPVYVRNSSNDENSTRDSGGMLWRQCTKEYKLEPVRKRVRDEMKKIGAKSVIQWIGISLDEAHRMRDSGVKYITNHYPLIDLRMTRHDCLRWMEKNGFPHPPKSACYYCPYTNNARWAEMKRDRPDVFQKAVEFDRALRQNRVHKTVAGITGEMFIHRSFKPLEEAVFVDESQLDLFGQECLGMCGV